MHKRIAAVEPFKGVAVNPRFGVGMISNFVACTGAKCFLRANDGIGGHGEHGSDDGIAAKSVFKFGDVSARFVIRLIAHLIKVGVANMNILGDAIVTHGEFCRNHRIASNGVNQGVGIVAGGGIRFATNMQGIALTNDNVLGKKRFFMEVQFVSHDRIATKAILQGIGEGGV